MEVLIGIHEELDINVRNYENYRSHWAIKDVDLLGVLARLGYSLPSNPVAPEVAREISQLGARPPALGEKKHQIFIVHGRDHGLKNELARWLNKTGFEEIILHEQPNIGRTIIQTFMEVSGEVSFAVVLATPDDVGGLSGGEQSSSARQNVILELGFFLGTLGPKNVAVLKSGNLELPSDYDGVIFINYDERGAWKLELLREFKSLGLPFDLAGALS